MAMPHEKIDFAKFGRFFQEDLCRIMLDDRQFCDQIGEVFKTEFLEQKYLQLFAKKLYEYKKDFGTHPSRRTFETIIKAGLDGENEAAIKQIKEFYIRITTEDPDHEGEEHVKKMSLDFCRKQNIKKSMVKMIQLLQNCSFEEISQEINKALKMGSTNDLGYEYVTDFEARYERRQRNPITTGWKPIDRILGGGLGVGELGVVIAPTGVGKSMALVHLAAQALLEGKNVIYYTLELEDKVVGTRFDSCITGVRLDTLKACKGAILNKIQSLDGNLIIKEYPTKNASTETIKNHILRTKTTKFDPDVILVDYADLLRPVRQLKETRQELQEMYEELRGIAKLYNCSVWTASQTNRGGLNAEVITMESISEAFNKCFVADFIFSISRTADDMNENSGRIFIAKNRNGPTGYVYSIEMDTAKVLIKVLDEDPKSPKEITEKASKRQEKLLKEKYEEFKKERKTT
jgi:RecA/RadA recombinase